jgi:putative endonuclease
MHSDSPQPARQRAGEPDRRRTLGRLGERLAAAHLQQLGYTVIARNLRTRHGEIDLIAFDGATLVFAEVKARRVGARQGSLRADQDPLTALRPRQRARLRRLGAAWLREQRHARPMAETIRFDAIGVVVDPSGAPLRVDHVEGAW